MRASNTRRLLGLLLIGTGLIVAAIFFSQSSPAPAPVPTASATQRFYGPLVPTARGSITLTPVTNEPAVTPTIEASSLPPAGTMTPVTPTETVVARPTATHTPIGTATRSGTLINPVTPAPATKPASTPIPTIAPARSDTQRRMCASVPYRSSVIGGIGQLGTGWYLDWGANAHPARPNNLEYAQMVRVPQGKTEPGLATIGQIAQQNPGSLWLVGNEMDVIWQDNATPEQYAAAYHDVYATLKQADPSSRVAIGGITEPSPLRLQYLDRVLQAYHDQFGQDMPIDVWNVHNFILPEQRGSWGVDIPPGIDATSGLTYGIDDHTRLDIFKQQLVDFRRWMAERGYRDKELLVTEYGVLMPADYGFDYARVRDFMLGTFDILRTAVDPALGQPSDDNRLVQRWCWYSLADTTYPTGNLFDSATKQLTPLGRDFKQYMDTHP